MAHLVITIGCEYGAKGNQIGKKVAKDLGIKFYDRDTVDEIIKEVGIPKDIMEKVEEGITIAGKGAESMRFAMASSPLAKASTVRSIISVSAEESISSSFFAVSEKACPSATRRALRSSMFVA